MALVKGALTDLKNKFLTSIHGRKFGVDHNGFTIGHNGYRLPYEQSTAASTLANYGTSILSGAAATHTLNAPPSIGARKEIINASSVSTATMNIIRSSSGSGVTFSGSTALGGVNISLIGRGAAVDLVAISSLEWAIKATASFSTTAVNTIYTVVSTSS